MAFTILIEPEALKDIQKGIDWYNEQSKGLGKKFHRSVKASINSLHSCAYYQIRYDQVRCLPLKRFPFTIHYTIQEDLAQIIIRAVFHTARNPEIWKRRE